MKTCKAIFLLFLCIAAGHASAVDTVDLPYYLDGGLVPEWANQIDAQAIHQIDDFSLLNQQGKTVAGSQMHGKVRVVNFFFATCPGVCPTTMQNLKKLQPDISPDNSMMLSFSITANIDTPERLKAYAETQGIDGTSWQLFTGDVDQITNLAENSFFAVLERNVSKNAFVHTEKAFLVDQKGHIRGVYNATSPADVKRLSEDLSLLTNGP